MHQLTHISVVQAKRRFKRVSFTFIKSPQKAKFKHLIGNEIIVNIIDILPDNSYVYKAKADQNQSAVYGVIKKVK